MRHAKSSWNDPGLSDFDRPLNDRGERAAPFMGTLMRQKGFLPELIVSSPAKRASRTAELVNDAGSFEAGIVFNDHIYEASPRALREVVAEIEDTFWSVLLVGHNPGFEGFVRYLTGVLEPMPTAALAVIDLDITKWGEVNERSGELKLLIRPKDEMA